MSAIFDATGHSTDGRCSKAEFVNAMLVKMGKLRITDVAIAEEEFKKFGECRLHVVMETTLHSYAWQPVASADITAPHHSPTTPPNLHTAN